MPVVLRYVKFEVCLGEVAYGKPFAQAQLVENVGHEVAVETFWHSHEVDVPEVEDHPVLVRNKEPS